MKKSRKREPILRLSSQELQCLDWSSIGKTSTEIGLILKISPRTVNDYIQRACRKLGVQNRRAAITIAIFAGLIHSGREVFREHVSLARIHQLDPTGSGRPER